jgi:transcriptional regulator with XRE-family HTH domain
MQKTIHGETYRRLILWLRQCRQAHGFSMRTVAERLGVPHTWVGKIEQFERRLDVAEFAAL